MPGLFMSYIWGTALQKTDDGFVYATPFTVDSTKIPLFDPGTFTRTEVIVQNIS